MSVENLRMVKLGLKITTGSGYIYVRETAISSEELINDYILAPEDIIEARFKKLLHEIFNSIKEDRPKVIET